MKSSHSLLIIFNILLLGFAHPVHGRSCCVPITQGDIFAGGGVFTISESAVYQLIESVTGKIVIDTDDVVLDLCGKKITNTNEGVMVNAGKKNTTIRNGTVESEFNRGIVVYGNADCCGPTLENVRVENCTLEGVLFHHVKNGRIEGCEFISNATGLVLDESEQVVVKNTVASCNKVAGFSLDNSSYNCFSKCKAFANGGGDVFDPVTGLPSNAFDRFGFVSTDGCGNVFEKCCAEANTIPFFDPIGFCRSVAGFAFVGTETCSKIIDCKSENNWAPYQIFDTENTQGHTLVKSATPYGILLKQQLHVVGENNDQLELVTALDPGGPELSNFIVRSVDWLTKNSNTYLAMGGNTEGTDTKILRVYEFDGANLNLVAAVDPGDIPGRSTVHSVNWLIKDSTIYLAVGGEIEGTDNKDLRVYTFNPAAAPESRLTLLEAVDTGNPESDILYSVNWLTKGADTYLAVGGSLTDDDLRVYTFNPSGSPKLTLLVSVDTGALGGNSVRSVDWSPDGMYLAVGGLLTGDDLKIYSFDPSVNPALTLFETVNPGYGGSDIVRSVNWSPDGMYLAVGGILTGKDLRVYKFDSNATTGNRLDEFETVNPGSVRSVNWSSDGTYLAVGGSLIGDDLRIYEFKPEESEGDRLEEFETVNPGGDPSDTVYSVNWLTKNTDTYLAVGGQIRGVTDSRDLRVYKLDTSANEGSRLPLVTAVHPGGLSAEDTVRVDWSPDGKYLAVGGTISGYDDKDLRVYLFDPLAIPALTLIAAVDPGDEPDGTGGFDTVYTIEWSPDGKHLAMGGLIPRPGYGSPEKRDLRVYSFDPAAHTPLTLLTAVDPGDEPGGQGGGDAVYTVDWSPDGKYLAAGGRFPQYGTPEKKDIRVYSFDPAAATPLTLAAEADPGEAQFDGVNSVDWSPDGKYLAVGGEFPYSGSPQKKDLVVYAFDLATSPALTLVAAVNPGDESGGEYPYDFINTVEWSPDGCFLAVGGAVYAGGYSLNPSKDLRVYSFDIKASPTLTLLVAVDPGGEPENDWAAFFDSALNWSPDGKHLAVGGIIRGTDSNDLRVYTFDVTQSPTLMLVATVDPGDESGGGIANDIVYSVDWSPDGQYLAIGGSIRGRDSRDVRIYKALDFPTKNIIKRNIVACNCIRAHEQAEEHDEPCGCPQSPCNTCDCPQLQTPARICGCDDDICPKGVGISGTSICNMIMENEAYNNPFNYQFVTNVFDQRFGNMPSLLQNIALGACQPVCIPFDCGRLATENNALIHRLKELMKNLPPAPAPQTVG